MDYDLHEYGKRLGIALRRIKNSSISERNKDFILRFHRECFSEGLSLGRIVKYIYTLLKISELLGKDFDAAKIEDIKELAAKLEQSKYAEATKSDFRQMLKKFYRWLRGTENYPEEVKWLRTGLKLHQQKLPEELLTEEEVKKLIDAARLPRDRALVSVLYESGCRIGELAGIKLKNVAFDQHGAQLTVKGKTGPRRIRIIASVSYLADWINKHPLKGDPEAFLWITNTCKNNPVPYQGFKSILLRIRERAGIKKKVNPHNFRHSRATFLANHLTEAQMKEYFGWVQASDMASVYVHLSGRDVDNAIKKVYGIADESNSKEESLFKPKQCQRCKDLNAPTNTLCSKCGTPLDSISHVKKDIERKTADEIMNKLWEDSEVRNFILSKIQELKDI